MQLYVRTPSHSAAAVMMNYHWVKMHGSASTQLFAGGKAESMVMGSKHMPSM
jgi:hypothetical protein